MARPENTELKRRIKHAAWRQFREVGYNETSFSSIAEECGISRNLAQYHFRKKADLAISLMEEFLTHCLDKVGCADAAGCDLRSIYEVGCCFFISLLEGGFGRFLLDLTASREMTEEVIAFNADWAFERVGWDCDVAKRNAAMPDVIVAMGGFYELLYHSLKHGERIDVAGRLADVMTMFALALGVPRVDADRLFADRPNLKLVTLEL